MNTYYGLSCLRGYDLCASKRDRLNWRSSDNRFFCSELRYGEGRTYGRDYNSYDYYEDLFDNADRDRYEDRNRWETEDSFDEGDSDFSDDASGSDGWDW